MPERISEATSTAVASPVEGKPGRFLIKLIDAGWGSSGYYSAEVLKAAGEAKVWPAKTHMYLDHPTRSEEYDRPERTIRDLAAVLSEDATYDPTLKALVAEAKVFPAYRPMLEGMAEDIGVSIRAYAESEPGEAEGRRGQIMTELVEGISVDYVTHAGRGGAILQVIESARAAIETTSNDTRALLDAALVDAYGEEDVYVWVEDFDDSTVWFCQNEPDSRATYAQSYTLSGSTVTLDGDPTEVRPVRTYVPVGESGEPSKQEDGTMPQIEEHELSRLRESDRQLADVTRERDEARQRATTAESERDEARETNARHDRSQAVARIMRESLADESHQGIELDDYQRRGILADAVIADGTVDEAKTRAAFDKALDKLGESTGGGKVRGMGSPVTESGTDADADDPLKVIDDMAAESFDFDAADLAYVEG